MKKKRERKGKFIPRSSFQGERTDLGLGFFLSSRVNGMHAGEKGYLPTGIRRASGGLPLEKMPSLWSFKTRVPPALEVCLIGEDCSKRILGC